MTADLKPTAWLCELAQEDGKTRWKFVEEYPDGLRWNDSGEPSPYRTTPLVTLAEANAMVAAERARLRQLVAAVLEANLQARSDTTFRLMTVEQDRAWNALLGWLDQKTEQA